MEEEEELARALEESARMHAESADGGWEIAGGRWERDGVVQEALFNQFHAPFVRAVCEGSEAPSALCGYVVMALAPLLCVADAEERRWRSMEEVVGPVGAAVRWLDGARQKYIAERGRFESEREKLLYRRAWVANYEISDWLRAQGERAAHVVFVRFNQFSEREVATHEEWERLEEEGRFGDDVVLVECFGAQRRLLSEREGIEAAKKLQWRCAVLDLAGHFALAVKRHGKLVVLNTTSSNYLTGTSWRTVQTAAKML